MKWLLGLSVVVVLVVAALFGVGQFLLPNTLSVSRSVEIDRPRATVFALIEDLRIVKEWSPYYARDPDADYVFSGEEFGPGQTMRWQSDKREVGAGRMSIVSSVQNQSIDYTLDFTGRASLNATIALVSTETGANAAWTIAAECRAGIVNVPCRYANLVLRSMVERDLDTGLARLKTLTEKLPNVDFENLNPEFVTVEPKNYIFSLISTSSENPAQVDHAMQLGLRAVDDYMGEYQLTRAGPQVRVTTGWDEEAKSMSFRVGYPFSGPTPLTLVNVQIGQTPSGRALRVVHSGPADRMSDTYAQIYAFLQAHRVNVREGGLPWEVVLDEQGARNARVEIFVPLE